MQLRITVVEVGAGAADDEYQEELTKLQAHLTEGADKGWRIEAYRYSMNQPRATSTLKSKPGPP